MKRRLLISFILVFLDWLAKEIFERLGFVIVNQGFSFGLGVGSVTPLISVLFSIAFTWAWLKKASHWGLLFLVAGAWGNTMDRIQFNGVRDYIHYPLMGLTGNLADIYLLIGVCLLAWGSYNTRYANTRD